MSDLYAAAVVANENDGEFVVLLLTSHPKLKLFGNKPRLLAEQLLAAADEADRGNLSNVVVATHEFDPPTHSPEVQ